MRVPTDRQPFQTAWVVADIEAAVSTWSAALGIGPFYVAEYSFTAFDFVEYRGAPGQLHMKTAIAYAGDRQVELVQALGTAPSAYHDVYAPGSAGGFHHVCFWSDDLDADMSHYVDQGCAIANYGQMKGGGARFAYVDAWDSLGTFIELLERDSGIEALFDKWRERARTWDGETSIVRL